MLSLTLRKKRLWIACFLWIVLLGVLAMEPNKVVKMFFPTSHARDFAHVLFYGVLAFLLCLYWRFKRRAGHTQIKNIHIVVLSFALTALFGGITELMQLWTPDRLADWGDLGFDMIGAALGIISFYLFRRWL